MADNYPGGPYPGHDPRRPGAPGEQPMTALPGAGFSVPGGGGPNRPRRWWLLGVLVVAGVAVLIAGVVAAIVINSIRQPPPSQVAAPPSGTPTSSAGDFPRPASTPGGDPTADQALWDALKGGGVQWTSCEYDETTVEGSRSYLYCATVAPTLSGGLTFQSFSTPAEVTDGLGIYYSGLFTGSPGTCDSGGKFRGQLLGRDAACGVFTYADGSTAYMIVWTDPGGTMLARAADTDPAKAWQWFQAHDPF